jgi:hypothetical protein
VLVNRFLRPPGLDATRTPIPGYHRRGLNWGKPPASGDETPVTETYLVGSAVSGLRFAVSDSQNIPLGTPALERLELTIADSARRMIDLIQNHCGPCPAIDFIPERMQLVIRHARDGHEEIESLLKRLNLVDAGPIAVTLTGISQEWADEGHENEIAALLENADTVTETQAANAIQSCHKRSSENNIRTFALVPGRPTRVTSHGIPLTVK